MRQGAQGGFGDVFAAHHRGAYRLALLLCGDPPTAEDAVAEAFARVYPHWREGRVRDVGPYLRQAVVNEVRGGHRRLRLARREEARRRGDDRGDRDAGDQAVDTDVLRRALDALSPNQRAVVVLRYYEDRAEADIASLLGMGVGTVKSHLSRGLDRLRAAMPADETDAGGDR